MVLYLLAKCPPAIFSVALCPTVMRDEGRGNKDWLIINYNSPKKFEKILISLNFQFINFFKNNLNQLETNWIFVWPGGAFINLLNALRLFTGSNNSIVPARPSAKSIPPLNFKMLLTICQQIAFYLVINFLTFLSDKNTFSSKMINVDDKKYLELRLLQ